jgi:hypothetical protein
MTIRDRVAMAATFARKHGARVATELLINLILPYVIYALAKPSMGEVKALIASSAPPIIWSLVEFARHRRVDFISVFVLAGIALSLLAMAGGGSVKFLQLRERLVTVVIGLAFVISALIGRPLIYEFAAASMRRNGSEDLATFEAHRHDAGFKAFMKKLTLVWGFGLLAEAGVAVIVVLNTTVKQYLIIGPIIGYSSMGLLIGWTFLSVRKARAAGDARRAAEEAAAAVPAAE